MLKENYSTFVKEKIRKVIESKTQEIKFEAKAIGIKANKEWEANVSEEALSSVINQDINTAETKNFYKFSAEISNKLLHILKELYPDNSIYSSGHFYYPPTGFMGWHTNYKMPEERIYITYASEQEKSFFRYLEGDKVITDYDDQGLTVRRFSVSNKRPYFWHCAGSDCDRFSFGYRLKPIES
tara:strand:+ start:9971 stop:10519 length:549 start_codon:yes stop_codon:yes gene_type:complete